MKKQITTWDWLLFSLLITLIFSILLVMYQIDRQWLKLTAMETAMSEQAKDIRELRSTLGSGVALIDSSVKGIDSKDVSLAFKRSNDAANLPDYAQGDWSVEAFGTHLKTITPLVSTDAYANNVQSYVLESLINRNPDTLSWEGLVAKNWTMSEDGLVIRFQLRDDVNFSDGISLTADDVVFTFNFIMTEAIQAPRDRAYLEKIKSVQANGKFEVVFTFKEPYFEALSLAGSMPILAQHFYEPYLKEPQKFNESKGVLFGSGPYKLMDAKNWSPDKGSVELVRNDHYWGDVQPSYHRILWKIIQNDSARLTTYRNGDIDSYAARPVEFSKWHNSRVTWSFRNGQCRTKSQIQ